MMDAVSKNISLKIVEFLTHLIILKLVPYLIINKNNNIHKKVIVLEFNTKCYIEYDNYYKINFIR